MSNFPLRDALFPAVLVSSAVFSFMTLPLVLLKPEPVTVNFPPFFEGEIQPLLAGSDRSLAIPYIGCAIVASVGAGVATVELTRRRQTTRNLVQFEEFLAHSPGQDLPIEAEQVDPLILASQADVEPASDFDPIHTRDSVALEGSLDAFEPLQFPAPVATAVWQDYSPTGVAAVAILASHQYQTCRIALVGSEQRSFAILFEGEYYSLFRARKTEEKALEIAGKLTDRGSRVAITQNEQGHAVWVWEPEANSIA